MNNVILTGRLTKDADIRQGKEKLIARFTLAVDRKFKSDDTSADFISCVAFGKTAEFIEKFIRKGVKVGVVGRIQTGSYKNSEGKTIYTTDVIIENIEFCESKKVSENNVETVVEEKSPFEEIDNANFDGLPF